MISHSRITRLSLHTILQIDVQLVKVPPYIAGAGSVLRDTYSVSVGATELARRCGLEEMAGALRVEPAGLALPPLVVPWACVRDLERIDNTCLVHIDRYVLC